VLILAPQLVELETLRAEFEKRGCECRPIEVGRLGVWTIPPLYFTLAVAGHGKTQFALQTQYLLDHLDDTEGVICVGGAGGLDPRLHVGDIVIGTVTVEHDYCIRFIESPLPVYPSDAILLSGLKAVAQAADMGGDVWFDRIASGDEDIIEPTRAAELREQTGAVCVAWEGSGAARAAAFNDVPFVEIRGITDAANETAHGDYHQNLKIVMPRIAELLLSWRKSDKY
jgi:adenosylhomocysteine nucleosidase